MNIAKIIKENSLEFGQYVIKHRALPDLRDGMKPVHRRILYTMDKMKAYSFTKSQNISGSVTKLHPHGDVYPTMVTMAQTDGNLTPYIVGKGNFSQHTSRDLQAGASRYTEAKLSDMGKDILKELDKKTVEYIPNFDGSLMMPEVLPVKFPAVLHYAQEGIAYSMASKIPSFNLKELCEAVIKYVQTGEETVLIPDFATGGYVLNQPAVFEKINKSGIGSIRLRAKAEIKKNTISITEIPYSTTREAIIDKVIDLVKAGKLKEVTDIKDLTGLHGMEIEITCKKSADMELVLEKLYQNTPLETSYSCNMNVIVDGLPKVLGVWGIVDEWTKWRTGCIRKGLTNDIAAMSKKLHLLKGLEAALLDIDSVIHIIRYEPEETLMSTLEDALDISPTQAEYIANMKLRNINKDYITKQIQEIHAVEAELKRLKEILDSDDAVNELMFADLKEVADKYGQERKTKLITIDKNVKEKINKIKNEVPDYNVRVIVTKDGYVKKLRLAANGEQKLKDGDSVVREFMTNNRNELVVFSGTDAYKIKLDSLTDCKSNMLGDYIPTLIGVKDIIGYTVVDDRYKNLVILYDNGKVAKVDIESFKTESNRKKLANSLYKGAAVVKIFTLEEDVPVVLTNKKGKKHEKHTSELQPKKSRATQGVTWIKNLIDIEIGEIAEDAQMTLQF